MDLDLDFFKLCFQLFLCSGFCLLTSIQRRRRTSEQDIRDVLTDEQSLLWRMFLRFDGFNVSFPRRGEEEIHPYGGDAESHWDQREQTDCGAANNLGTDPAEFPTDVRRIAANYSSKRSENPLRHFKRATKALTMQSIYELIKKTARIKHIIL